MCGWFFYYYYFALVFDKLIILVPPLGDCITLLYKKFFIFFNPVPGSDALSLLTVIALAH
jgi:hypothetical protein